MIVSPHDVLLIMPARSLTPLPLEGEELKKKKKKKGPKKGHAPGDKWCRRHKNRNKPICQPEIPRHADEGSPSRTNGWGTPLGYAQVGWIFLSVL
jgi:hypothetical protein